MISNPNQLGKYIFNKLIGKGTYGVVYEGKDTVSGRKVAIKKYKNQFLSEGLPVAAIREIALLKKLDHPNIIR